MINARKGNAHSLAQTDVTGSLKTGEGIVPGMLVKLNTSNEVVKVTKLDNATRGSATNKITTSDLIGFAVTKQSHGDAIASGKITFYALDGGSVIETDQYTGTFTAADIGKPVVQDGNSGADGKVTVVAAGTTERIIGVVYDAPRVIYNGQTPVTVLPIKLSA